MARKIRQMACSRRPLTIPVDAVVQPFGCANGHDLLANLREFRVSQLHEREIDPFDPKDREPENALYSKDALRYRITHIESIGWGQICKKAVWHC